MIRFECPECGKKLGVKEMPASQMAVCPACKHRFRITITSIDDAEPGSPAPKPKATDNRISHSPPPKPESRRQEVVQKRKRFEEEDEDLPPDEEEEEERTPRRKRRKKRRKSSSGQFGGLPVFVIALIGLGVLAAISLGLALIVPVAALVPIGLGWLLSIVGGIWFLVIAFQDSPLHGLLCLCIPFYSLYYLITNFEETKIPFFINVAGAILTVAGSWAGSQSLKHLPEPHSSRGALNQVVATAIYVSYET